MITRANRTWQLGLRLAPAALLALAPVSLAAQDGQFDLRTRASPTPTTQPTVVGPDDPDTPSVRARPTAQPTIELPSPAAQPSPAETTATPSATSTGVSPIANRSAARPVVERPGAAPSGITPSEPLQTGAGPQSAAPPPATGNPLPLPGAYQPRDLNVVSRPGGMGRWLALAALALLLLGGAWLAWNRHFRYRTRALAAPIIERPRVTADTNPAQAPLSPPPSPLPVGGELHLALQATRMSATLINTTLSYRLAVTNRGPHPLHDVRIAGDMISAHASRPADELLRADGASLPELHRIAALAPGESVTLGGDIRLPLVSITPIRRGDAALFVPLARLRAHGQDPDGTMIEGGGTFLVGQEPGASKRLQPFRLDLGPRNYSRLGQQLLPAA